MASRWRLGPSLMTSRRLGLFLCFVGFVWGLTLMNMTPIGYSSEPESDHIKGQILQLSQKYVKTLAKETQNTIDGPYSGRLTGYDLKKTMAVLLQDIMERLSSLEARVTRALANSSLDLSPEARLELEAAHADMQRVGVSSHPLAGRAITKGLKMDAPIDAQELILGVQEKCELEDNEVKKFRHCMGKISDKVVRRLDLTQPANQMLPYRLWMRAHWKSDPCYREHGVDGTDCSFRMYLSEIETWCPPIPGRFLNKTFSSQANKNAKLTLDLNNLLAKLKDSGHRKNYKWIRMRISRMWTRWVEAAQELNKKEDLSDRMQKKVLVHLGLLTRQSGFKIAETSFKGGPLGELVQWSDTIAALYILGHDLTITSEVEQLQQILSRFPSAGSQCQSREKLPLNMIFTDIVGLTQFKRKVNHGYGKFSCLLRIIDSFGTEAAFNNEVYAKTHHMKTQWGMQNLNPQQFFTMFPHSPDNSFMGFVVENHINKSTYEQVPRRNQAVVYGKAQFMWQGKDSYLNIIREFVDIHGTVFIDPKKPQSLVPSYVTNHGILSGPALHHLLRESKLFIGLGFPYEGPAPLEAIAQGCVYINPKFQPPHSSINTQFFKGKPTRRKVTSQHPYAEEFISKPHVRTVDISNPDKVREALRSAMQDQNDAKIQPYLPYEYTEGGMLQRLNVYLEHQEFCNPFPPEWPPASAVKIIVAAQGLSCKDVCMENRRICEPSYFQKINNHETLEKHFGSCNKVIHANDIFFPAFDDKNMHCVLQKEVMLFSCVGEHLNYRRLCPCRDFLPEQTALCKDCIQPLSSAADGTT